MPVFEVWETFGLYDEPEFWDTNNEGGYFISAAYSENAFEGEAALSLKSRGISFEGFAPGYAWTTFEPNIMPTEFSAAVLIDSLIGDATKCKIEINAIYEDSSITTIGYWERTSLIPEYEFITIPLDEVPLSQGIEIKISAFTNLTPLGYDGYASMLVDGIKVITGGTTPIKETNHNVLDLYPNPVIDYFILDYKVEQNAHLLIRDMLGRVVCQNKLSSGGQHIVDIELPGGSYTVILEENGKVYTEMVIVE